MTLPLKCYQISKIIERIKPDIVHAHYISKYGVIAALVGFKPMVMTAWGSDILLNAKGILKIPTLYALKKADNIYCDGKNLMQKTIELGADPKKIKLIYFGTDVKKFSRKDDGEFYEHLKAKLGVSYHPIVISTRYLNPLYDVKTLIQSAPIVLEQIPDAQFFIFSNGIQEGQLKAMADSLGISHNVHFMGIVPNEELPDYLSMSDVYVSTSLSDGGIASSTLEAMACQLPVVITDVADNRLWVKDDANGYIFEAGDFRMLGEKIIYLLKNKGARARMGENNRKLVYLYNNYNKEMEKIENTYTELIKM